MAYKGKDALSLPQCRSLTRQRFACAVCGECTNAVSDEPIFVLRAQDKLAPGIVRRWALAAEAAGSPKEKIQEALNCADDMDLWQENNTCKVPD